jgi:hypothetical protein
MSLPLFHRLIRVGGIGRTFDAFRRRIASGALGVRFYRGFLQATPRLLLFEDEFRSFAANDTPKVAD